MAERVYIGSPSGELDLTDWIKSPDGGNYGEAAAEVFLAQDGNVGERVVDTRWTNRTATLPLNLKERGGTAFATIRGSIQAFAAEASVPGGGGCYVTRVLASGGTVQGDVQAAGITLSGGFQQAHREADNEAELRLQTLPDWYTPSEVTAGTISGTATGQAIGTFADIDGDFPEGNRCRLVVTAGTAADVLGVKYAIRAKHYSADTTARLSYEAEALQPLDLAAATALSGASGGTAIRHNNLGTGWTPVLGTNIGGTAYMTHTGTYRLEARVYTTSTTPPEIRCVYDVGDLVNPAENDKDIKQIPGASNFYLLDLGEIRLDRSPVGNHRWLGQIQARGAAGGENVYVDRIRLWPVDEYYAQVSTTPSLRLPATGYTARDEFNQSSGNLTGKTAASGQTWTVVTSSDATDFTLDTTNAKVQRSEISDADANTGRYVSAGTTAYANIFVQAKVETNALPVSTDVIADGIFSRLVDINNWLMARLEWSFPNEAAGRSLRLRVYKRVSGTVTELGNVVLGTSATDIVGRAWNVGLVADVAGSWRAQAAPADASANVVVIGGADSVLAAGGTLDDGKIGIYDVKTEADAAIRKIDDFQAWVPERDAVIYSGEGAELRTDGCYRASVDGVGSGALVPYGNYPRLPVSGADGSTVEVMVVASRGDFDQLPDSGLDDLNVQVVYRPTWLTTPGG